MADGLPCRCGGHGCLDEATKGQAGALTADMVAAAANSGDAVARAMWGDARRYLAVAIGNAVTRLNPQTLVLGGTVLDDVPELVDEITGGVLASTSPPARDALRIDRARLGEWAGVLGVAALAGGLRLPNAAD